MTLFNCIISGNILIPQDVKFPKGFPMVNLTKMFCLNSPATRSLYCVQELNEPPRKNNLQCKENDKDQHRDTDCREIIFIKLSSGFSVRQIESKIISKDSIIPVRINLMSLKLHYLYYKIIFLGIKLKVAQCFDIPYLLEVTLI